MIGGARKRWKHWDMQVAGKGRTGDENMVEKDKLLQVKEEMKKRRRKRE